MAKNACGIRNFPVYGLWRTVGAADLPEHVALRANAGTREAAETLSALSDGAGGSRKTGAAAAAAIVVVVLVVAVVVVMLWLWSYMTSSSS